MGEVRSKWFKFVENFFLLQARIEISVKDRASEENNLQNEE